MHVILVYIYYFHGYILYHLLYSIFMYCYHVLLSCTVIVYCFHALLSCTVHVLISYTVFMYCSCTIFIYCFPVILFILLSLSCTVLVHILFVYCTLYFSYTVFMYCFIYCHISYTVIFHILSSCTFHIPYYHINFSDHFTFLYIFLYPVGSYNLMLQNLSSHSSAMLLRSYHIFSHVIFKSFVRCFMPA